MKPFKLLACLVTLPFTCGLTLQAADPQDFRQWTDNSGRTITARLIDTPTADSVKIERQDGRFFTVAIKTFSSADQAYVKSYSNGQAVDTSDRLPSVSDDSTLTDVTMSTWTLLTSAGTHAASRYNKTQLDEIISGLNQGLADKSVKTANGLPFKVRTEPEGLASRIQITGDMPSMNMAAFLKEVARLNDLLVRADSRGMLVLIDKPQPAATPNTSVPNFFGVPISPP